MRRKVIRLLKALEKIDWECLEKEKKEDRFTPRNFLRSSVENILKNEVGEKITMKVANLK